MGCRSLLTQSPAPELVRPLFLSTSQHPSRARQSSLHPESLGRDAGSEQLASEKTEGSKAWHVEKKSFKNTQGGSKMAQQVKVVFPNTDNVRKLKTASYLLISTLRYKHMQTRTN